MNSDRLIIHRHLFACFKVGLIDYRVHIGTDVFGADRINLMCGVIIKEETDAVILAVDILSVECDDIVFGNQLVLPVGTVPVAHLVSGF
jgi:hypothetical protein